MPPNPTPAVDPNRVPALVRAYLEADYRWELDGQWLPLAIGEAAPAPEAAHPGARDFGFLSAYNPASEPRTDRSNRASDEAMRTELVATGKPLRPAFASAPNRSWREPGWLAVDLGRPAVHGLMQRFGQLGVLWWARESPVRLHMDAAAPAGWRHDERVVWLQAVK